MWFKYRSMLARLEAHYPCVSLLVALCIGQLFAETSLLVPHPEYFVVAVFSLTYFLLQAQFYRVALGLLAGLLSTLVCLNPFPKLEAGERYVTALASDLRYPKPGAVAMTLTLPDQKKLRCKALQLPWREASRISEGSFVNAAVVVRPLTASLNPFAYERVLWRHGMSAQCSVKLVAISESHAESLRNDVKEFVEGEVGSGERAGMLLAMSLGFRDLLSDRTENAFRTLGLSHLLVFSGYQVGLLFGIIYFVAKMLCKPILPKLSATNKTVAASILGLAITTCFVGLIGFEPSSVRALLSAILFSFAAIFEYKMLSAQILCAALVGGIIIEPGAIFEPSLQLTAAALFGMWLGSGSCPWGFRFAILLRITICASLTAGLVALCWFGNFSILSPLLNPILAPLLSFVGCPVVLAAIILAWCGAGIVLVFLATVFQHIAFAIVDLARSSFVNTLGDPKIIWAAAGMSAVFLLLRLRRKIREERWAIGVQG